jgi:hypothetical protein
VAIEVSPVVPRQERKKVVPETEMADLQLCAREKLPFFAMGYLMVMVKNDG